MAEGIYKRLSQFLFKKLLRHILDVSIYEYVYYILSNLVSEEDCANTVTVGGGEMRYPAWKE
jgi:hypothetical protein